MAFVGTARAQWSAFRLFDAGLHLSLGDGDIVGVDDVVAPFHGVGLVPADLHTDCLRYTSATHIPYRRSAEVMEFLGVGHLCPLTCLFPGPPRSEEHTSELQSLRHLVC